MSQISKAECVRVLVRCRPLNRKEQTAKNKIVVRMDKSMGQVIVAKESESTGTSEARTWTYDAVFPPTTSQEGLYSESALSIVDSVMQGYNGTIFAYGQTGTGKTFTMEGVPESTELQGIIPRAFQQIFDKIALSTNESEPTTYLVSCSFLEIYQETIRDLLSDTKGDELLELKEDANGGVYVKDLTRYEVEGVTEITKYLAKGQKKRKVGETKMNRNSSRSHCIFRVTIERSDAGEDGEAHIRVGQLNLVDLAGSERQSKTGAAGVRLQEATKINLSLSALGNVIRALTTKSKSHIPYRDSKLTRLLQDSLGGNTKTVMIANIGPADYNVEETISTLRFASRAKNIQNKPSINEDPQDAKLRMYQDEIAKLKLLLEQDGSAGGGRDAPIVVKKVVERVVTKKGVSEEERQRMEEETRVQREAIEQQIRKEREAMLEETIQATTKKEEMATELMRKEQRLEMEKEEREIRQKRLKEIENKLLHGEQVISQKKENEIKVRQKQAELERSRIAEETRLRALRQREEAQMEIAKKYDSQEAQVQKVNEKLRQLREKYKQVRSEIDEIQTDFQQEREEMLETIRELQNQIDLKEYLLESFVDSSQLSRLLERTLWNETTNEWEIQSLNLEEYRTTLERPTTTTEQHRPGTLLYPVPQSTYLSRACGDSDPRYFTENIMLLELDLPDRTTQNFAYSSTFY